VQTACTQTGEILARAPLDNGNVDARQCQLARQHQPCRASSDDHHRMLGHSDTPVGISGTPTPGSSSSAKSGDVHTHTSAPNPSDRSTSSNSGSTSPRDPYVGNNTRIFVTPISVVLA
jgi:hypothetical protein